jgi:hypothetical protein
MLVLLADPVAAKARVAEMTAATAEMQKSVSDQKAAMAEFAIREADHKALLAQQSTDAAEKLAAAESAFAAECAHRKQQLDDRAAELAALQLEAASDAKAAKIARADYERRLAIIKSATG